MMWKSKPAKESKTRKVAGPAHRAAARTFRRLDASTFRPSRAAFSLVELLMVITILSILITISVVVGANVMTSSRVRATQATVKKVNDLVMHRVDAFNRWAETAQEMSDQNLPLDASVWAPSGQNLNRARVLKKKQLFIQHFPQTNTDPDPDLGPTYDLSGEILYLMLTDGESFGVDLGDVNFLASELGDSDLDGVTEIVDSWGHPLRFYRWPTRLIRPAPDADTVVNPARNSLFPGLRLLSSTMMRVLPSQDAAEVPTNTITHDPDDPLGLIRAAAPSAFQLDVFNPGDPRPHFEATYHTIDTWHLPLVVSAGRDGLLGIYEPSDTGNFGHLAQPIWGSWQANKSYATGDVVYPANTNHWAFECTNGGTAGAAPPSWPNTIDSTVTDGSVTWTSRSQVNFLPPDIFDNVSSQNLQTGGN